MKIIEEICKNKTNFTCFDTSCVGFGDHGQVLIDGKAKEEVEKSFVAPEVSKGRIHRLSLMFTAGKVLESAFCWVYSLIFNLDLESGKEVREKAFQHFFGLKEIIDGCTERFLPKRWNAGTALERVFGLIENFPKC